jgi:hypothetical protein
MMLKSAHSSFLPFQTRASRSLRKFSRALVLLPLLLALSLIILSNPQLGLAQSNTANSIGRAYVDSDGGVQIVDGKGKNIKPLKEKGQVSCDSVSVAEDKETVGWLAQFPNCCTSYPIGLTLVIWRSGKIIQRLGNGMVIARWHFVAGGKQAAFYANTVHGDLAPHYELRDLQTGRQLDKWDGPLTDKAPSGAQQLSD